ncbi:MAG: M48 family metalloprotease [Proteobacteria bacterium]|nr:M48 family metalloprotease [Pseudomonadota bacterium]MBU1611257.1 M48 family metalloprotease [Pseudomonadota bacterium]
MTSLTKDLEQTGMNRRRFLKLITASTATAIMAPLLDGCAKNPVTGQQQLMFVSREQEIALDKENSPHQFSADNGPVQDTMLNDYVSQVGIKLATMSHRPEMPYSYRVVNANYVNAYAFPGGSIATTRGLMLELENEAELAALLGHETGHVASRHQASRMTQGLLVSAAVLGGSIYVGSELGGGWGQVTQILGGIAAGALLAFYSRSDEREADHLGIEYTTRIGLSPQGMIGLQQILVEKSNDDPGLLELMFASHPMSSERLATAKKEAETEYAAFMTLPVQRERFMDNTANLRKMAGAIKAQQKGEKELGQGQALKAEKTLKQALSMAPDDYSGLLLMSSCQAEIGKYAEARKYATEAKAVYPQEAKANQALGVANLMDDRYDAAYENFTRYDSMLPGNPQMLFLRGVCQEGTGNRRKASSLYAAYIQKVGQGDQASYAYSRLSQWGAIRK